MTTALQVGEMAPDFVLPADDGSELRLSDLRGQTVVLYFYPKDNTTGCTKQACGFRDSYPEIETGNAQVIGISPDDSASHQKFRTMHGLPFRLLTDADHAVATQYGAWGEKKMYGKTYMGIIRSHFIIDPAGYLADVQVKVSPAESVKRALALLKRTR